MNKKELNNLILNEIFGFGKKKEKPSAGLPGIISKESPLYNSYIPKAARGDKEILDILLQFKKTDPDRLHRYANFVEKPDMRLERYEETIQKKRLGTLNFNSQIQTFTKIREKLHSVEEVERLKINAKLKKDYDFYNMLEVYKQLFLIDQSPKAAEPKEEPSPKAPPPGETRKASPPGSSPKELPPGSSPKELPPGEENEGESYLEATLDKIDKILQDPTVSVTLDAASFIPVAGEVIDLTRGINDISRGRYFEGLLNLIGAITLLGDAIGKGGKVAAKTLPKITKYKKVQKGTKVVRKMVSSQAAEAIKLSKNFIKSIADNQETIDKILNFIEMADLDDEKFQMVKQAIPDIKKAVEYVSKLGQSSRQQPVRENKGQILSEVQKLEQIIREELENYIKEKK